VLDIYSRLSLIWRYSYCLVFQGATSLARKEYNTRSGGWDDTTDPKMWFYPLPNNANDIDVHPIGDFSFFIAMYDF
ncbi:hypothetical protein, partial [Raoultella planticola]